MIRLNSAFFALTYLATICLAAAVDERCLFEAAALANGSTVIHSTCDVVTPCGSTCANLNSLAAVKAQVTTLEAENVPALTARVTSLEGYNTPARLTTLKARVTTLEAENVPAVTARVTSLEGYNTPARLTTLKARVTALEAEDVSALTARVTSLEGYNTPARLTTLIARVTKIEADNIALRKLVTDEIGALKLDLKETKANLKLSGIIDMRDVPTLSTDVVTVCGVATNPTTWQVDNVGMLGTYSSRKDKDNWSMDCRLAVKKAMASGAKKIVMRIYDPVDSGHMDFSYTLSASEWYDAFQNPVEDPESVTITAHNKPTNLGGFLSHKAWSVGHTANENNVAHRVLTKLDYVRQYCDGGSTTPKYSGKNTKTTFNFIVGGGGTAHASLCSNGLGMYGESQCTTGTRYNCYIGGKVCNDRDGCRTDAAQRAAVSIKLA